MKVLGFSRTGHPQVLNSQTCTHWASSNSSVISQVLFQCWFSWRFLLCKLWFFISTYLSPQFKEQQFALWPQFSDGSKNCWFSVSSVFVFRSFWEWEWWLPSSLHGWPETKVVLLFFFFTWVMILPFLLPLLGMTWIYSSSVPLTSFYCFHSLIQKAAYFSTYELIHFISFHSQK